MKRYLFLLSSLIIFVTYSLFSQEIPADQVRVISGTITHKGVPLDSVLVIASDGENPTQRFTTSANGRYSFFVRVGRSYSITPSKVGYTFDPQYFLVNSIQFDEIRDFVTTLRYETIRGTVTLRGSRLSGVTISITGDTTLSDTTQRDGSYEFQVEREGNYTITPSKGIYVFLPPNVVINNITGTKTQNFEAIDSVYLISGKVTLEGDPLEGVDIKYSGSKNGNVITDSLGNYAFTVLLNSNITITPSKDQYIFTPADTSFTNIDLNIVQNFIASMAPPFPEVPVLLTPANKDSTFFTSLDLTWKISPRANIYFLQVATDTSFKNLIIDRETQYPFFPLINLNSGTYYWRVAAKNVLGISEWSAVWSFTILVKLGGPPVLTIPLNNAIDVPLITALNWEPTTGAIFYKIQVSTNADFSNLFIDISGVVNNNFSLAGLQYYTKYYWRVLASNYTDTTRWSEERSFTTIAIIPSRPTLISPANNFVNAPINTVLSWNPVVGTSLYRLEVSTNSNFSTTVVKVNNITSTNYSLSNLLGSTTYYWRVAGENNAGVGQWTDAWKFTTISTPPTIPTLLSPTNLSNNVGFNVTLSWSSATYATNYDLDVSTSADFEYRIVSEKGLTLTQYAISNLEPLTYYYWRVRAKNNSETSNWSQLFMFQTKALLAGPVLRLPEDDSKVTSINGITLAWYVVNGASYYNVEVSTNSNFVNAVIYNTTNLFQTVNNLEHAKKYYWRARALLNNEFTSWSNPFSFTTISSLMGPVLSYPLSNSFGVGRTATFIWEPIPNAVGYEVQVSFDENFSSFVVNRSAIYETYTIIKDMTANSLLWWRVRGYSLIESGEWSSSVSFRTASDLLSAPVITYPTDDQKDVSLSPVLSWGTVTGAESYEVIVSDKADMSNVLNYIISLTNPSYPLSNLNYRTEYYWKVIARRGSFETSEWSPVHKFTTGDESMAVMPIGEPDEFQLMQNYPNPFNPKTNIKYSIPKEGQVSLKIFNIYGQEIETLVDEHQAAGTYILSWQPNNLPSGIYIYKIQVNGFMDIKKMMFLK